MENLLLDIIASETFLRGQGYILDHRMPWYTLIRGVSATRIDAHSYAHALHQAVTLVPTNG